MMNLMENQEPSALAAYIEDTHHSYLKKTLPELAALLNTILRVYGKEHEELFELYRLFGNLKIALEQHLLKEETMYFPMLKENETDPAELERLSMLILSENETIKKVLSEIRRVTNCYSVFEEASQTFIKAYNMMKDLEDDLCRHMELEHVLLHKRP